MVALVFPFPEAVFVFSSCGGAASSSQKTGMADFAEPFSFDDVFDLVFRVASNDGGYVVRRREEASQSEGDLYSASNVLLNYNS